jgi:hypothetical protein
MAERVGFEPTVRLRYTAMGTNSIRRNFDPRSGLKCRSILLHLFTFRWTQICMTSLYQDPIDHNVYLIRKES